MLKDEFPALLRDFRERNGRSGNALAHEVGVDPSYLTRIEHGEREPPRAHIVIALCRALRLSLGERSRFMVAAGYAPLTVTRLGGWDEALEMVSQVLNNDDLTEQELEEYRSVIKLISARWVGIGSNDLLPRVMKNA